MWAPSHGPITADSHDHILDSYPGHTPALTASEADLLERSAQALARQEQEISDVLGEFMLTRASWTVPSYYELIWNRVAAIHKDRYYSTLRDIRVDLSVTNMPLFEYFAVLQDRANKTETAHKAVRFVVTHTLEDYPLWSHRISLDTTNCPLVTAIGNGLQGTCLSYTVYPSCVSFRRLHGPANVGWFNPLRSRHVVEIHFPRDLFAILTAHAADADSTTRNLRTILNSHCDWFFEEPEDLVAYDSLAERLLVVTRTNTDMTFEELAAYLLHIATTKQEECQP